MIDGRCSRHYPRAFSQSTVVGNDGYPIYMRRDDGRQVQAKGVLVDNHWIIPYNPFLSMKYKTHINVGIYSTISTIKYLYKYIYKGHDRVTIKLQMMSHAKGQRTLHDPINGIVDEIYKYLDARYVSTSKACWRIYDYDMHEEKPNVQRLQVHLPMLNNVIF